MYEIFIEDLEFFAVIGILDFERKNPQKVKVFCHIGYEDKSRFIDYAKVSEDIKNIMKKKEFFLIEDAIDYLIDFLKDKYQNIKFIKLQIFKPEILPNCKISVSKLKKF